MSAIFEICDADYENGNLQIKDGVNVFFCVFSNFART